MVKAGKSTLLNAIIGEEVAPTDAGECTKVIIWYRHGATPRLTMQLRDGTYRWWTWALFPLPLLAFDLVFARSLALTTVRRSVSWRGRDVSLTGERSEQEVA